MDKELKNQIEEIFRTSSDSNQLFDYFNLALSKRITDVGFYKTLLGNPFLNFDELKMYCSKLVEVFPKNAYDYFLWVAAIFENSDDKLDYIENAISYYKYASIVKPDLHEPYILLSNNYNHDVEISTNEEILLTINDGLKFVSEKSKIYYKLAEIYKKKEQFGIAERYCALAEKAVKKERRLRNSTR